MKKKFVAKKSKSKRKIFRRGFFLALFFFSCFFTIRFSSRIELNRSNEDFLRFLLENQNVFLKNSSSSFSYFHKLMTKIIQLDLTNPVSLLNAHYKGLIGEEQKEEEKNEHLVSNPYPEKDRSKPTVYIYNTHQTEEYRATSFLEYSVEPNVMMASYILQEELEKDGYQVLVEEDSVVRLRNAMGLNYAGSYQVTRAMMEQAKEEYPSLTYFVDMHRDSITYDKTTLTVDGVSYAKILFIVGLENPTYPANLAFTEVLDQKLNEKLPGISKGIYKKEGEGVNGVYNQDFSPRVILVEMGGPENTIDEVYRSVILFSEVLSEAMKDENN